MDSEEIGPRAAEARGSRGNLCRLFVARKSLPSLRRRPRPTRPTPVQVGGRLRSGGGPAPRRRRAFRALTVIWCRLGPARTRPGTGPAPRLPEPGRRWFGPGNRNPRGRAGSRRRARADVNVVSLRAMCRRRRRRGIPRSAKQDRKRGFGRMREFAGRVPLFAWLCTVKTGACDIRIASLEPSLSASQTCNGCKGIFFYRNSFNAEISGSDFTWLSAASPTGGPVPCEASQRRSSALSPSRLPRAIRQVSRFEAALHQ